MENIEKIVQLLNEVKTISESYERVAEATGENFNIFSILRIESDEIATHSRFIAELLNPKGRHGKKDIFLIKFINLMKDKLTKDLFQVDLTKEKENEINYYLELLNEFQTCTTKVRVEVSVGNVTDVNGGRLDILLKDGIGNVIMIENKIYAAEQKYQLLRYKNAFSKGILIYLTLYGVVSEDPSSKKVDYIRYSYKEDIIKWLEDSRKESATIPILRESITQYVNLIKKITNQNLSKEMSRDIIDKIVKGGHLKSYKILYGLKDELVNSTISEIVLKIKKSLSDDKDLKVFNISNFLSEDLQNGTGRLFSFQSVVLEKNQLSIKLYFKEKHSKLVIGFYNEVDKKLNEELFSLFSAKFKNSLSSIEFPSYINYSNYETWWLNNLDDIYFNYDDFYDDLKKNIKTMLEIINKYDN